MPGQVPFRDYSLTPLLAFIALTTLIIRGDIMTTLRHPGFLGVIAVLAVSIGVDLWRKRIGKPR